MMCWITELTVSGCVLPMCCGDLVMTIAVSHVGYRRTISSITAGRTHTLLHWKNTHAFTLEEHRRFYIKKNTHAFTLEEHTLLHGKITHAFTLSLFNLFPGCDTLSSVTATVPLSSLSLSRHGWLVTCEAQLRAAVALLYPTTPTPTPPPGLPASMYRRDGLSDGASINSATSEVQRHLVQFLCIHTGVLWESPLVWKYFYERPPDWCNTLDGPLCVGLGFQLKSLVG